MLNHIGNLVNQKNAKEANLKSMFLKNYHPRVNFQMNTNNRDDWKRNKSYWLITFVAIFMLATGISCALGGEQGDQEEDQGDIGHHKEKNLRERRLTPVRRLNPEESHSVQFVDNVDWEEVEGTSKVKPRWFSISSSSMNSSGTANISENEAGEGVKGTETFGGGGESREKWGKNGKNGETEEWYKKLKLERKGKGKWWKKRTGSWRSKRSGLHNSGHHSGTKKSKLMSRGGKKVKGKSGKKLQKKWGNKAPRKLKKKAAIKMARGGIKGSVKRRGDRTLNSHVMERRVGNMEEVVSIEADAGNLNTKLGPEADLGIETGAGIGPGNMEAEVNNGKRGMGTEVHPFYDMMPAYSAKNKEINFFPITTEKSEFWYDFDLLSGKRFFRQKFCWRPDIWNTYDENVNTPPYTAGIIPRILDQSGRAQRIIIFGYNDLKIDEINYQPFRAKIIGGLYLSRCQNEACTENVVYSDEHQSATLKASEEAGLAEVLPEVLKKSENGPQTVYHPKTGEVTLFGRTLISHYSPVQLIVVAVNPQDEDLGQVQDLASLKELIDWDYVQAFLANEEGGVDLLGEIHPFSRLLSLELNANEVVKKLIADSIILKVEDMIKMRGPCLKLYDYIWDNLGVLKFKEYKKQQLAQLAELNKSKEKNKINDKGNNKDKNEKNNNSDNLLSKANLLAQDNLLSNNSSLSKIFQQKFYEFNQRFGDEYQTCIKYVRPDNPAGSFFRHWFFSYFEGVYRLRSMGYNYDCDKGEWQKVEDKRENTPLLVTIKKLCSSKSLDNAFPSSISFMHELHLGHARHYRFIEYDSRPYGTHNKLFSWIEDNANYFKCSKNVGAENNRKLESEWERDIFPQNVKWTYFTDTSASPSN